MEFFRSVDVQLHVTGTEHGTPVAGALEARVEQVIKWVCDRFGGGNVEDRRGFWYSPDLCIVIDEPVKVVHTSIAESDFTIEVEKEVLQQALVWKKEFEQECVFVEFVLDRETAFV